MSRERHVLPPGSVRVIVTPELSRREKFIGWFSLLSLLIGISVALTVLVDRAPRQETIQSRIEVLSRSLDDAASIIADIEHEVNERKKLVSDLERRARVAEQLQDANREQVEAIALLLRGELDRQENWNFWVNVAQNALFMILGAFLGYFVERWMGRRRQTEIAAG
jgi:septal ring factor EnvC (AmiA/AmiB activator)